jgi:nitrous oxidase accessory protein NosD
MNKILLLFFVLLSTKSYCPMKQYKLLIIIFLCLVFLSSCQREVALNNNLLLSQTCLIKKSIYQLNGKDSLQESVITIEGENLTIDFQGATLQGSNDIPSTSPEKFYGLGVLVKGKNITIKNLIIKGFKVALMAVGVEGLTISHCDFSYNYRPRLFSNQEREDIADWLSYHQNEKDEWLRYGAGIYLKNCHKAQINNCTITNGQNALMMTNCNDGLFYNNNFSFNSGIGVGMYRCSRNQVIYNQLDWNVRGYSHEVYQRGQDSAGILVYEQSHENTFAYNSVTHSGDGFFLWAGQTTMDTGEGGCNDNLLYGNDFSHAPTNGVEVTFSRNKIINNRIEECNHGIWGGYSYETLMLGNIFRNNQKSIAIEHGQKNEIAYNLFENELIGIHLWSRKEQPKDWGYAQNRDVRSIDYQIIENQFNSVKTPFQIFGSENLVIKNNAIKNAREILKKDDFVQNLTFEMNDSSVILAKANEKWEKFAPKINNKTAKGEEITFINPMLPENHLRGRKYIMMTQYGAYNFQYPILWLRKQDSTGKLHFEVFGKEGTWKIKNFKGLQKISAVSGTMPSSFTAMPQIDSTETDIAIEAEYIGSEVISPFGEVTPKGQPYQFVFKKYFLPIAWQVKFFAYEEKIDLAKQAQELSNILKNKPLKEEKTDRLEYRWWRGIGENLPSDYFVTVAEGETEVIGEFEIGVTADDGVRVYVDDKLVIDAWQQRLGQYDEAQHYLATVQLHGKHKIRIEHFEKTGFATLMLSINKL